MKTVVLPALAAAAFVLALPGVASAQSSGANSSFLTRELNRAPPAAVLPTPGEVTTRPAPQPVPTPAPAAPVAAPPVLAPSTATRPPATSAAPAASSPATVRPATASTTPPPAPTPAPVTAEPAPPAPPPPTVLNAAAVAALPFRVDLPAGVQMTTGRPGPNFNVWTIRKGETSLVMIYAGPGSQFPIYDGQMVNAGGRSSIVVTENNQRLALEHLFQRTTAPAEIHVWVASVDGEDRILAERIAQTVDPK